MACVAVVNSQGGAVEQGARARALTHTQHTTHTTYTTKAAVCLAGCLPGPDPGPGGARAGEIGEIAEIRAPELQLPRVRIKAFKPC